MPQVTVHPKTVDFHSFIGQTVWVQFRGSLGIFKAESCSPPRMTPVQEDVNGELRVATSDVLVGLNLQSVSDGFACFSMKGPDGSVASFAVPVDLVAAIWRPVEPPGGLLVM